MILIRMIYTAINLCLSHELPLRVIASVEDGVAICPIVLLKHLLLTHRICLRRPYFLACPRK